jgi:hypothetical protein
MDAVIMIGNSDDKLSQRKWARFCIGLRLQMAGIGKIHGQWFSLPASQWQNMALCVEFPDEALPEIEQMLADMAHVYEQGSIALLTGTTRFIGPKEMP